MEKELNEKQKDILEQIRIFMSMKSETVTHIVKNEVKLKELALTYPKHKVNKEDYRYISSSISPTMQGTMLDILMSWHITGVEEIDKYCVFKTYYIHAEHKILEEISERNLFEKARLAACATNVFRSGLYNQLRIWVDEIYKNPISESDLEALQQIYLRMIKRFASGNFIDNPKFISFDHLIKGDGDFIIDDTLIELKSSSKIVIDSKWILQLMFYKYINDYVKEFGSKHYPAKPQVESYVINKIAVYNPLYDYYYEMDASLVSFNTNILDKRANLNDEELKTRKDAIKEEFIVWK